jgi:predicted choloylglycine hydrolase
MDEYVIEKAPFGFGRISGSAREMGMKLGRWLKEARPAMAAFYAQERFIPASRGFKDFAELEAACERACPGIVEEIGGFADSLGIDPERVAFWSFSALKGANCSHAAISPGASATGTALAMRSYEWKPEEDDLLLLVTRKKGAYAHLGCSCILFGRMDGMNEKGLSVTMSGGMAAGLPPEWNYKTGLNFWVVIRGMLERCASVREGLEFLRGNLPTGNHSLILADASGEALLAEMSGGQLATKDRGSDPFIASVNHFRLEPLALKNKHDFILAGSVPRLAFIEKTLAQAKPRVSSGDLKKLLAGEAPMGCFGPWYSQGFGTLWASIFDLGKKRAEYCFGAPGFGAWEEFGLEGRDGFETREAVFAKK